LAEHALLTQRIERFGDCHDAMEIWQRLGVEHPEQVTDLEAVQMQNLLSDHAVELA
jgi:malonate decarboxylase beta subunit